MPTSSAGFALNAVMLPPKKVKKSALAAMVQLHRLLSDGKTRQRRGV
jgi:hypothetical protein